MQDIRQLVALVRDLIGQSRLEEAIETVKPATEGTRLENEVIQLSARLALVEQQRRLGLESSSDLDRSRNQISHALLQLLDQLPDGATVTLSVSKPPATGDGNLPAGQKGTGDGGQSGNLKQAFGFAVAAFAILLAITLLRPEWAGENNALFRTLLALAAGGMAATLPGFLHLSWGNVAKAGGALAAFLLVFLFNPAGEKTAPVALRVYVEKQNGGWSGLPFSSEATVRIIFPSGPKTARLFDGQAEFPGVPPEDLAQPLRVRLENTEPFVADSVFDLRGKSACHLLVRAVGLGKVRGQVFDEKKQPLAGVALTLEGLFDTTDTGGLFEFSIPESQQKDRYRLIGTKAGYRPYDNFINPGPQTQRVEMLR